MGNQTIMSSARDASVSPTAVAARLNGRKIQWISRNRWSVQRITVEKMMGPPKAMPSCNGAGICNEAFSTINCHRTESKKQNRKPVGLRWICLQSTPRRGRFRSIASWFIVVALPNLEGQRREPATGAVRSAIRRGCCCRSLDPLVRVSDSWAIGNAAEHCRPVASHPGMARALNWSYGQP